MQTARRATNTPSLTAIASFRSRAMYFQLRRFIWDRWHGLPDLILDEGSGFPDLLAESVTPLFTDVDPREQPLLVGKNENLRLACASIDGRVLKAGQTFSFWRQVGPPRPSRGFVMGREVREGCVVPSVGGGLCQLSGSLLETACLAGLEIVERHGHTVLPADLRHNPGRDATVFWNYVDLRFRTKFPVRLECSVTNAELIVALRGRSEDRSARLPVMTPVYSLGEPKHLHNSCVTCGETRCARHPAEMSRK